MKDCIFANVMVNNSNIPTGSSLRVVMAIGELAEMSVIELLVERE